LTQEKAKTAGRYGTWPWIKLVNIIYRTDRQILQHLTWASVMR